MILGQGLCLLDIRQRMYTAYGDEFRFYCRSKR